MLPNEASPGLKTVPSPDPIPRESVCVREKETLFILQMEEVVKCDSESLQCVMPGPQPGLGFQIGAPEPSRGCTLPKGWRDIGVPSYRFPFSPGPLSGTRRPSALFLPTAPPGSCPGERRCGRSRI